MGQVFANLENVGPISKDNGTQISMPATYLGQPVRIAVGGQTYKASSQITVDLTTTGANGLDTGSLAVDTLYHVYAVQSAGSLALVASTSGINTGPSGFGAWKEVGRFRTFQGSASVADPVNLILGNRKAREDTDWAEIVGDVSNVDSGDLDEQQGFQRRAGDSMEIHGAIEFGATISHSTLVVPIVPLYFIDASKIANITGRDEVALGSVWAIDDNNNNNSVVGTVVYNRNSDNVILAIGSGNFLDNTTPFTLEQGDTVSWHFTIPIREFRGLFD